jgi:hypothetical protein
MGSPKIEPHKITKPIQLVAVWIAGLVLVDGIFFSGAKFISTPEWLSPMLCIFAFIITIIFAVLIFLMQTKYRPQLQEDPYYAEYLRRQEKDFKDFKPESIMGKSELNTVTINKNESWGEREKRRIQTYEQNMGLFLVHTWRPSHTPGQVADIAISIYQHGDGPLSYGKVENVEYHLGAKFFEDTVIKTNAKENFKLDVSAYGPMLCLARVNFNDGTYPLDLERYINF